MKGYCKNLRAGNYQGLLQIISTSNKYYLLVLCAVKQLILLVFPCIATKFARITLSTNLGSVL